MMKLRPFPSRTPIVIRRDFPRNATGKVLKHQLRDEILAEDKQGSTA